MKFLIDECLSPELATMARQRGHPDSTHVTWTGLRSRPDHAIARRAVDGDFVLVTHNTVDFRPIYAREGLHVGFVGFNVAPGLMSLDLQRRLFAFALSLIEPNELINEALEVTVTLDRAVEHARYAIHRAA